MSHGVRPRSRRVLAAAAAVALLASGCHGFKPARPGELTVSREVRVLFDEPRPVRVDHSGGNFTVMSSVDRLDGMVARTAGDSVWVELRRPGSHTREGMVLILPDADTHFEVLRPDMKRSSLLALGVAGLVAGAIIVVDFFSESPNQSQSGPTP